MKDKLFGLWQLEHWKITDDQKKIRTPLGKDGTGYLFYLPNGYMSVHLMNPTFLDFKSCTFSQQAELSDTELQKFMEGYFFLYWEISCCSEKCTSSFRNVFDS